MQRRIEGVVRRLVDTHDPDEELAICEIKAAVQAVFLHLSLPDACLEDLICEALDRKENSKTVNQEAQPAVNVDSNTVTSLVKSIGSQKPKPRTNNKAPEGWFTFYLGPVMKRELERLAKCEGCTLIAFINYLLRKERVRFRENVGLPPKRFPLQELEENEFKSLLAKTSAIRDCIWAQRRPEKN